ncbi:hypothetical protein ElyMa_000612800 [Elysia marginata]|uniref:PH domain-containing protein n=1 Tax=Elysia marginata TaxID=1093978 RepID=A0AAV4G8K7_9GAST|nr:hypothetical protein ElyMa_000612800 [Elysia marginata]
MFKHFSGCLNENKTSLYNPQAECAYISPRSPTTACSSNTVVSCGDIGTNSTSFDGNRYIHSTGYHRRSGPQNEGIETGEVSTDFESSDQFQRRGFFSNGRSSPDSRDRSKDKQRRGRSRERHAVSKNCDSPAMPVTMEIKGVSTTTSKKGSSHEEDSGNKDGVKASAGRIIARRRPSPKRSAAPCPPNPRSCPSPAPKPVSTSDVSPADVEGWLLDQLRGRFVWCVLSDMLFCVFETPEAKTSKHVLVLPGCTVRVLEFKSAHLHLNNRRILHGARLNSSASSTSASSDANVVFNNKDDNNNKQGQGLESCNGKEIEHNSNGTAISIEATAKSSTSSSISSHSVIASSSTRGGSIGSEGSSVLSDKNNVNINTYQSINGAMNNKTVSGVDRFQFVIENTVTRQKHMFAVTSRSELDVWTGALNKACSLDIGSKDTLSASESKNQGGSGKTSTHHKGRSVLTDDIILTDGSESSAPSGKVKSIEASPRSKGKAGEESMSPSYTPRQTLPSRIDVHSLSLSLTQPHDVSKETVDEIRRKLKKDNHPVDGIESKPIPLKATHLLDEKIVQSPVLDTGTTTITNGGESPRKGRQFFKGRSPLDVLLGRKKRSASADDAYNRNRKLFPVYKRSEDNLSNSSFSPRQAASTGSQQSLASSHSSHSMPGKPGSAHDSSFSTSSVDSRDSPRKQQTRSRPSNKQRGSPLARSWDPEQKTSRGFGASIRRTASDLKERVFGGSNGLASTTTGTKSQNVLGGKSKAPGLKLKDLNDAKVKGHLQYRVAFKFVKVFCVLSKGCFYAFKSEKPDEVPLLAMVLSPCSVTYVVESELQLHRKKSKQKQNQRIFAFKLSQPHCKSIYACADNPETLMQWVMAIQAEACKVQVDEDLAVEIKEKPSTLKKKLDQQLNTHSMSKSHDLDLSSFTKKKQTKQIDHRFSCPAFDEIDLKLALAARANNFRDQTLNGLITPRRGAEGLSSLEKKEGQKEKKERKFKDKISSALFRSKSDRDVDLSLHNAKSNELQRKNLKGFYKESKHIFSQQLKHHDFGDIDIKGGSESLSKPSDKSITEDPQRVSSSQERTVEYPDTGDGGRASSVQPASTHQLRLDLSSLADGIDNEDPGSSARSTTSVGSVHHQSRSYRELENGHPSQEQSKASGFSSPTSKLPWKPSVKRSSSLTATSLKSPSRFQLSKSSLLPSKSRVFDDLGVGSTSTPSSHKNPTRPSQLTSFSSPNEPYAGHDVSPSSHSTGYRENSDADRSGFRDVSNEDQSSFEMDIISPPPLFRSPDPSRPETYSDREPPYLFEPTRDKTFSPEVYSSPEQEVDRPRHLPFPAATDPAVREARSRDEDYLLGVLRDKLRNRSRRQRDPDPGEQHLAGHVIIQVRKSGLAYCPSFSPVNESAKF